MRIPKCTTAIPEPRSRINSFLTCSISSLLLGAIPFSSCHAQGTVQVPASEPAVKNKTIVAATPTIDATTLLLKDIEASTTRDRTISDDDLAFILQFAQTPGVDQLAAYHALAPLQYLWPKHISDSQYDTIHKFVMQTLLADDKLTDTSGLQKAVCLGILVRYSRSKALRPIVENLRNDSRPSVSKTAAIVAFPRWWDNLKN